MATFTSLGTGFLDPRSQKKQPTGGSISASQGSDTSYIITGNPNDSIGFSSPSNQGDKGLFQKTAPTTAPDPEYMPKTSQEWKEQNAARGIAPTHDNMGSLAVDFRESEAALTAAGKPTVQEQRDTKILDTRAAEEHKRTIIEPAAAEAAKFRAQAAAAKDMFGDFNRFSADQPIRSVKEIAANSSRFAVGGRGPSGGRSVAGKANTGPTGYEAFSVRGEKKGPDFSWVFSEAKKDAATIEATGGDLGALRATKAHSAAPGTQTLTAEQTANRQSGTGKATPTELIQARVSKQFREQTPNA